MKEIVLDTETTGLSVKDGHRIVEIGCVELENNIPTNNNFHTYLNPEKKVSEEAVKVHGYTDEFLSNKKKFSEIVDEFLNFIGDKKLIIHNAGFDLSHINNELSLLNKKKLNIDRVIDTLELARNKFPGSQISLDALCKRFRIDNSKREKHSAIVDCELLSKVYVNLIGDKEPSFNFSNNNQEILKDKDFNNITYSKKVIKLNDKDLLLHKDFLKKELKKNYFN